MKMIREINIFLRIFATIGAIADRVFTKNVGKGSKLWLRHGIIDIFLLFGVQPQ